MTRVNNINLKLLQTFLLAAVHGSFRRAAELGQRSPSAISMQIKDLEAQIGMSLFIRTPQRVVLTPEGKILFTQIQSAMDSIHGGLERLAEISAARQGHIKIACAPTLAASRLGNILSTFKTRFPKSQVNVKEMPPREALVLLQEQEAEFYVGPELPNLSDFEFQAVIEDRLVFCIPPLLDKGDQSIALGDLDDAPIILLDKKTAIRTVIDEIISSEDIKLNAQYEVQNAHTAVALASAGLGIAIVPGIALGSVRQEGFRVVPIDNKRARRSVGIITARGYVSHTYSEQLMELICLDLKSIG